MSQRDSLKQMEKDALHAAHAAHKEEKAAKVALGWNLTILGIPPAIILAAQIICGTFVPGLATLYPNAALNATLNIPYLQSDAMFQFTTFMGSAAVAVMILMVIKDQAQKTMARKVMSLIPSLAVAIGYYVLALNDLIFINFQGVRYGLVNAAGGIMFGVMTQFITGEIHNAVVRPKAHGGVFYTPMDTKSVKNALKGMGKNPLGTVETTRMQIMGPAMWNMIIMPVFAVMFLLVMYETVIGAVDGVRIGMKYITFGAATALIIIIATLFGMTHSFSGTKTEKVHSGSMTVTVLAILAIYLARAGFFVSFVYIPGQMLGAGCGFYDANIAVVLLAAGVFFGRMLGEILLAQSVIMSHVVAPIAFMITLLGYGLLAGIDQNTCDAGKSQGMAFMITFGLSYIACWHAVMYAESASKWADNEMLFAVTATGEALGPVWAQLVVWACTTGVSRDYNTMWWGIFAFVGASAIVSLVALLTSLTTCCVRKG